MRTDVFRCLSSRNYSALGYGQLLRNSPTGGSGSGSGDDSLGLVSDSPLIGCKPGQVLSGPPPLLKLHAVSTGVLEEQAEDGSEST